MVVYKKYFMAEDREIKSDPLNKSGEEQLAYLGLRPEHLSGRVLELGSGKSEKLKETLGLSNDCEIISLSRNILEGTDPYINTLRKKPTWDRKTIHGDVLSLPFKDETFNYVLSVDAIPLFLTSDEAIKIGFREIWRVLKPGGEARLIPASERDLERARNLFATIGGNVDLQKVDVDVLRNYGYFDNSAKRLVISKSLRKS